MKKLTIYDVYISMTSQEQCDRMKRVCIDYKLPYHDCFKITSKSNFFECFEGKFCVYIDYNRTTPSFATDGKSEVTEEEFLKLL